MTVMQGCSVDARQLVSGKVKITMKVPEKVPQTLTIPDGTTTVSRTNVTDRDAERVVIPDSVTTIRDGAFQGMKSLTVVVFQGESALEKIGVNAFQGTSLASFVAPISLRSVAQGAFSQCKMLKQVQLNEGLKTLGPNEFATSESPN